ncbi:MAG TPA: SRPBCC family protein [Actinopolymorphaceae bacterium]
MAETEFVIEPGRQDIVMTHVFDAPRAKVFLAVTDPELVTRWLGPRGMEMQVDTWQMKPGGLWRYVHRDADGNEYGFHGVVHDISTPERIVQTFEFEGLPGHVSLETLTLEEIDGRTRYVSVSVFQSVEDRDGMAQSGMQEGSSESFQRLEELLGSLS